MYTKNEYRKWKKAKQNKKRERGKCSDKREEDKRCKKINET